MCVGTGSSTYLGAVQSGRTVSWLGSACSVLLVALGGLERLVDTNVPRHCPIITENSKSVYKCLQCCQG